MENNEKYTEKFSDKQNSSKAAKRMEATNENLCEGFWIKKGFEILFDFSSKELKTFAKAFI